MSWNKQEGNAVTETISGDLTNHISKYGFTLQNDKTSEYITQNIDNYVNIEKNGNITSVSLQQVDDSSYYKLNMNLNNNDTISESVITIKSKNIIGTNNLTYTLKQIFGKKIWLKLFSNDEFISDKYYAIKINTETIYLYNTPEYNSASTIKNSENAPIYTGSVGNTIDIFLQPKYGIASNLGFIDNYTITDPIQYNISRNDISNGNYVIASINEPYINDLKINVGYSEGIPDIEAIFKFENSEYPTINLHIVNDLIQFIYTFKLYLKYDQDHPASEPLGYIFNIFQFSITCGNPAGENEKFKIDSTELSNEDFIEIANIISSRDSNTLTINNRSTELHQEKISQEPVFTISYNLYISYNNNEEKILVHDNNTDFYTQNGGTLSKIQNYQSGKTYYSYIHNSKLVVTNKLEPGLIENNFDLELCTDRKDRKFIFNTQISRNFIFSFEFNN